MNLTRGKWVLLLSTFVIVIDLSIWGVLILFWKVLQLDLNLFFMVIWIVGFGMMGFAAHIIQDEKRLKSQNGERSSLKAS